MAEETTVETRGRKIRVSNLVMCAVSFGLITVAAWTASSFTIGVPGVGALWWPMAFYIAFSVWFGAWGVLAIAPATILGGIMAGVPALFSVALNIWTLFEGLSPALAFRSLKADPLLKSKKDWGLFVGMTLLGTVTTAAIGVSMEVPFGYIPGMFTPAWWVGWGAWGILDFVMGIILAPLLLKGLTPSIRRAGLYVRGWWS